MSHQLREVETLRNLRVKRVYAGFNCSFYLTEDNLVYRTGSNGYGQLSLSEQEANDRRKNPFNSPIDPELYNNEPIRCISVGGSFLYLLTSNYLYRCGQNGDYQLIHDDTELHVLTKLENPHKPIVKVTCGAYHCIIMTSDYSLYGAGQLFTKISDWFTKIHVPVKQGITDVICGYNYFLVLGKDNKIYGSTGDQYSKNMDGQIGGDTDQAVEGYLVSSFPSSVTEIVTSCSSTTTFVLLRNGDLYGCGCNERGGLGLSDKSNRNHGFVPIPREYPDRPLRAATGAFHSVICYLKPNDIWRTKLWRIASQQKSKFSDVVITTII
jgi:alpha-tubulin suppressor-like RCC1 family protein